MHLKNSVVAAGLAAFFIVGASPLDRRPPQLAMQVAQMKARAAQLRQRWMARHPGEDAGAPPTITAGEVLSASVNVQVAPAAPTFQYSFTTGVYGFNYAYFEFAGPNGNQTYFSFDQGFEGNTHGTHVVRDPGCGTYCFYYEPGTYTLIDAYIVDYAGNGTYYEGSQLASIFTKTSFTLINNGKPDITAPTIVSGKILTPTVSLSATRPYFEAQLAVSDDVSGVDYADLVVTDPNGDVYYVNGNPSSPITKTANMQVFFDFSDTTPTGTYTITEAFIQDVAGNAVSVTSASQIQSLFGTTTFTVTN